MHYTPGLRIRVNTESEIMGIDESQLGELAYDYVQAEIDTLRQSLYDATHHHTTAATVSPSMQVQVHPNAEQQQVVQRRRVSRGSSRGSVRQDFTPDAMEEEGSSSERDGHERHAMGQRWSYTRDDKEVSIRGEGDVDESSYKSDA